MNFNRRRKKRLNRHFRIKKGKRKHGLGTGAGWGKKKHNKRLAAKRARKIARMKNKPLKKVHQPN